MALSRRTGARFQGSIWPGFVDAMTGLLLVLMFVLTIFMVLQFVLQETITGQETQLNELSAEVAALADALGLEQDRSAELGGQVGTLTSQLLDSEAALTEQNTIIAQLTAQRDDLSAALSDSQSQITGFEAQVAGLLAQRRDASDTIATLEAQQIADAEALATLQKREIELLSDQDALTLALAQARAEIDEGIEAARLSAARREALQALIAELEREGDTATQRIAVLEGEAVVASEQINALEAQQLVDAAAAQALRDRLEGADAELTALTLALEQQRQQAEETLTLLAAAQAARAQLDQNLAIALLAQQEAQAAADALGIERATLAEQLAAALDDGSELTQTTADLEADLAAALIQRTQLEQDVQDAAQDRAALSDQLAAAVSALAAAQTDMDVALDRQTALLAQANAVLAEEEALSAQSQRQVAVLNEQVAALRGELGHLQSLLELSNDADVAANVQIETLTQNLNTAMARALLAERRAGVLEQAELERLAAEAEELEKYRSDFLGLLRGVLEDIDGVRIEGDRFVFSSEVLFEQGAAELSDAGRGEIAKVAQILRDVADDIPDEIDWVIRVDGHTDNVPLSGLGAFANNWELSQARALSVVLYMINFLGIPPERLAANGFGQYQPLNPSDSDEARAQNRRIELKLTER
jgi:chemotaxis protein MotB